MIASPAQIGGLSRPYAAYKSNTVVFTVREPFRKGSRKSIACIPSSYSAHYTERICRLNNRNTWTGSRRAELKNLAVPSRPPAAQTSASAISVNSGLDARVDFIIERLREDLPRQYVVEMDWSVYSPQVVFVDPVTQLRGKLLYRGMIWTLRLATSALFEDGSAFFELFAIEEVGANAETIAPFSPKAVGPDVEPAVRALRSTWATRGRSKWGADLLISGDDVFRIGAEGRIITHESAWNEDPAEIFMRVK